MTNTQTVLIKISEDGIAKLILNNPSKSNAFDEKTIAVLITQLQQLAQNNEIKVLLLLANGKNFCAGADLNWMQRMVNFTYQENLQDALQLAELLKVLNEFPKPVIGLVHGATYGGGVGLVACCDIVFATDDAQFCFSEVKLGLVPATIAPYIIQAIGARAARRYFLSAEMISAAQAWHLGLIHQVITHDQLVESGINCAKSLLKNSPQAMREAKSLIQKLQSISPEIMQETAELIATIRTSTEGQEGLQAFLTKRKPIWK